MHEEEGVPMAGSRLAERRVGAALVWTTVVLLLGIVILAIGHYSDNRVAFYAGMFVTLAGVLTGIQQLLLSTKLPGSRRTST